MAPLLERDMVDRLIIQVAPVLLGEGIPLFTQKEGLRRFCLDEVGAVWTVCGAGLQQKERGPIGFHG